MKFISVSKALENGIAQNNAQKYFFLKNEKNEDTKKEDFAIFSFSEMKSGTITLEAL